MDPTDPSWDAGTSEIAHVDLGCSAHVFSRDGTPLGHFLVQDLTSRGAVLTGVGVRCKEGSRVHILLKLPCRQEPIVAWGDVARLASSDAGVTGIQLEFKHLSADDEDRIEDAILEEWSARHPS